MNRRSFFQTIAAAVASCFLPKGKKEYKVGVDPAVGEDETGVVVYFDGAIDHISVHDHALNEEELLKYLEEMEVQQDKIFRDAYDEIRQV